MTAAQAVREARRANLQRSITEMQAAEEAVKLRAESLRALGRTAQAAHADEARKVIQYQVDMQRTILRRLEARMTPAGRAA